MVWVVKQRWLLVTLNHTRYASFSLIQAQPGVLTLYRPTGKEARRQACWRKPYLTGHVCSSMAPSIQSHCMRSHSGIDPNGVNLEVHGSELSDPIPGILHGSLPKPSEWRQSPCGGVNRANVRGQTTPTQLHAQHHV